MYFLGIQPTLYLGKLSYFTNLNSSAIEGDDSPNPNHHLFMVRSAREVVMKFTQLYVLWNQHHLLAWLKKIMSHDPMPASHE